MHCARGGRVNRLPDAYIKCNYGATYLLLLVQR